MQTPNNFWEFEVNRSLECNRRCIQEKRYQNNPTKLSSSKDFSRSLASLAGLAIDGLSLPELSSTFWATLRSKPSFENTLDSKRPSSSSGLRIAKITMDDITDGGVPATRFFLSDIKRLEGNDGRYLLDDGTKQVGKHRK